MEQNIKVAVVIPWLSKENRIYSYNIVLDWYKNNLPDATIISAYDGRMPFCLSGSRNVGVKQAQEEGAEVVIINDADTLPQIESLIKAIKYAKDNACCVLPYDEYRSLREDGTKEYLKGIPLEMCNYFEVLGACSGCYVTTPETWWAHYGQDERFRGWGFEDSSWFAAHSTLLDRQPHRIKGCVFSFHHDGEIKTGPQYEANAALCYNYLESSGNKEKMKDLASQGLWIEN